MSNVPPATPQTRTLQVLCYDDYGAKLPDGAWKYPNAADLVRVALQAQQAAIQAALGLISPRVVLKVASIPSVYERPDILLSRVKGVPSTATLIVGKDLVAPPLGRLEHTTTNRFRWSGTPGVLPTDRVVTGAWAPDARLHLPHSLALAQALAAANRGFGVGTEESAGKGPCNEALLLSGVSQADYRVSARGEASVNLHTQAPVLLMHVVHFVEEDRGAERRGWLIDANREALRTTGIDPSSIAVGSVGKIVDGIKNWILPTMLRNWPTQNEA